MNLKAILVTVALFTTDVFAEKLLLAAYYREGQSIEKAATYKTMKTAKFNKVLRAIANGHTDKYAVKSGKKGWEIGTHQTFASQSEAEGALASLKQLVATL
ncbi:hypothetical protein LX36DRAFT_662773 [Colletotrichum falcatum]|nr:hypothetical protein LX36DRAFT_662773 [Colletotrichum falcatum]